MSIAAPEMKVVVPLQSLFEPEPPDPTQLPVSIPRTLLHPSHPHSTQPMPLPAHSHSDHKSHKKHKKKKHKKSALEESVEPQQQPPKISPLRLPVPKPDPPHTSQPLDPAHAHTKHSKHKHKRSRDSMEDDHHQGMDATLEAPKFKRPKIGILQLGEGNSPEAEKRLVTPLHLQLPPDISHDGHKHKKKKKKHKHSKTSGDETAWEVKSLVPSPQPSPIKTVPLTSEPKATPTKIDQPPIQSSPGKQMRLLRGLEQSIKGKDDDTITKKQTVVLPRERPVEVVQLTPPTPVAPARIKVPQGTSGNN